MPLMFEVIQSYEDALTKIHGSDKTIYMAQFLTIKARHMQMSEGINPELVLANV